MSRIKILLLILIIAVLSIIFVQNQQPITLKLLCADSSKTCLYQTPSLPLAVWIALFVLTGAIANLLIQTLDRFGANSSNRKSGILDDELYPNSINSRTKGDRFKKSAPAADLNDSVQDDLKSYEVKQEPQNVEKSGSTYSYRYREAGSKSDKLGNNNNGAAEGSADTQDNSETDEGDWI